MDRTGGGDARRNETGGGDARQNECPLTRAEAIMGNALHGRPPPADVQQQGNVMREARYGVTDSDVVAQLARCCHVMVAKKYMMRREMTAKK